MKHESLIKSVTKINEADLQDLRSIDFVSDIIRLAGLYPDKRNIYGKEKLHEAHFIKTGLWQQPVELAELLVFLSKLNISSGIEIGTCTGYTAVIISTYLKRFNNFFNFVTIDPHNWGIDDLIKLFKIDYFPISSNQIKDIKFDFCFIDGRHTYDAVSSDYENVGKSSIVCAFHDINDVGCPDVRRFWDSIKKEGKFKEFVFDSEDLHRFGIGCLISNNL